uniref:G-protein coupled receptors family 3 profile domain-containing protein n=3 Tax=Xenopus tropicalis TaxID=8364 RepID=A0A803JWR8_XENTR
MLLIHFGWTWVGIITVAEDSYERSSEDLRDRIVANGNCVAYVLKLSLGKKKDMLYYIKEMDMIVKSLAKVIIVNFPTEYTLYLSSFVAQVLGPMIREKVLILIDCLPAAAFPDPEFKLPPISACLLLRPSKGVIPGLKEFLYRVTPDTYPNYILKNTWQRLFKCSVPDNQFEDNVTCSGYEYFRTLPAFHFDVDNFRLTYNVYIAVYALAHALHQLLLDHFQKQPFSASDLHEVNYMKLSQYLKSVKFITSAGDEILFDKEGNRPAQVDLLNWVQHPNETVAVTEVGHYRMSASGTHQFIINDSDITWETKINGVPQSTCSESCSPGYRKVIPDGNPSCCYDCIPCAEGEISNVTNMETCMSCPEEEWANSKKDTCVRKNIDFLSSQDALGATLVAFALLLIFMTLSVLVIFIIYRDTPIVRANNRDLSYTLLICLMLSFLCTFSFIGHPTTAICLLRQVAFSLIFTVAISSIVAKTITVLIAFRSTKPGSKLSKWTGKKLSAFIIILCTLVELGICTWSLVQFPPFPNRDTKTYTDRIILQCIATSSMGFYTTHGYILTLSLFNFALAFLVRKLPDRFNEAHYITFSMLLFCSVWISFIPAYLSAKGKYMVAVEVFAILASSAGLFCCIFIPKCCTILLKPHLNSRIKLSVYK